MSKLSFSEIRMIEFAVARWVFSFFWCRTSWCTLCILEFLSSWSAIASNVNVCHMRSKLWEWTKRSMPPSIIDCVANFCFVWSVQGDRVKRAVRINSCCSPTLPRSIFFPLGSCESPVPASAKDASFITPSISSVFFICFWKLKAPALSFLHCAYMYDTEHST